MPLLIFCFYVHVMPCFVQTPDGTLPILQKSSATYCILSNYLLNLHRHICAVACLRHIVCHDAL